ncbi:MAG: response regulator transcription factor [Epsilonproteobacteria bacterium]|nr:response regulator transcription factor [Campylobacterota bacterium]
MVEKKIKILIIEDDPELSMVLSSYLQRHGMEVKEAEDPYLGLSMLTQENFDLVILDLTLPGMDGLEVIEKIREESDIPIIISSARDDITDKVIGLERGADDYMPKPYDPRELITRIKTILRRSGGGKSKTKNELFELDKEGRVIRFKGKVLELTAAEFDVLSMLIMHKNSAISREQLLYESEHIDDESSIKNIDVIVSRIRQKIAQIDPNRSYIKPVRGVGYLLSVEG